MAISHAYLGNEQEANKYVEIFREVVREKVGGVDGDDDEEIIRWLTVVNPFRDPEEESHFVQGLRKAGLGDIERSSNANRHPEQTGPVESDAHAFRLLHGQREMTFDQKTVTLPEVKGFADIEKILARPGCEIHACELMGVVSSSGEAEAIDEKARGAYRDRICDLQAELEQAEKDNDSARITKIREELDTLLDHLAKVSGIAGRTRKLKDPAEKARSAVTWRIRSALKKIEPAHPSLAKHLSNSIRTGVFCSYSPEKSIQWTL